MRLWYSQKCALAPEGRTPDDLGRHSVTCKVNYEVKKVHSCSPILHVQNFQSALMFSCTSRTTLSIPHLHCLLLTNTLLYSLSLSILLYFDTVEAALSLATARAA